MTKTSDGRIVIEEDDLSKLENAKDGVLIHNMRVLYANPSALRLIGAGSLEDVLNMDILKFVAPEYRDIVRFRARETLNSGVEFPPMVEKILTLYGRTTNVEVKAVPAVYKGKKAVLVYLKSRASTENETILKKALEIFERIAGVLLRSSKDPYTDLGKLFHELVETLSPGTGFLLFRISDGSLWLDFGRFMENELHDMLLSKEDFPLIWSILESNVDVEIVPDISERIREMRCKCVFNLNEKTTSFLGIPIRFEDEVQGAVAFLKEGYGSFLPWEIDVLKIVSRYVGIAMRLSRFVERLELEREKYREKAMKDPLTGAYTRHFFEEWLGQFQEYLKRTGSNASLVVMDLDRLKVINDTYGHKMGDEVLKEFSNSVLDNIRGMDVFVRIGGDEFLVILPGADPDDAERIVKRIESDFKKRTSEFGFEASFSYGIEEFGTRRCFSEAFEMADRRLYSGKKKRYYNRDGDGR